MLIKFELDQGKADLLRAYYGEKTASKACRLAADEVIKLLSTNRDLRDKIKLLEARLESRDQLIEGARSAAALLLEKTGQKDMF